MARRRAQQRWIGDLVNAIRAGRLTAPAGSAAEVVATHRGGDGKLLARRTASVELLNVLRPTVAVAAYIVFEALALHDHPKCREKLRQPGNETYVEWFVQEVRRFYPFFSGGFVRRDFTWKGYVFPRGRRALLDLYGTNRDPRVWESPDTFRPERFASAPADPFAFVPQGGGDPRLDHRCAGECPLPQAEAGRDPGVERFACTPAADRLRWRSFPVMRHPMDRVASPGPPPLTVRDVTTRAFTVPLNFALGTSVTVIRAVPLLLVDVHTEQGIVGRAYLFCYTRAGAKAVALLLAEAVDLVKGQPARPQAIYATLVRCLALLGVTGAVRMAISALDIALWDAAAIATGLPLAELLGARRRAIPAYDSRGLGLMPAAALADEAKALLAQGGMKAIKLRLGYPTLEEDLAALGAVRGAIPHDIGVMVDYNQALSTAEAIRRGRALEAQGIAWLEEPIRHDDYRGNAKIARTLDLPLQIGENFNGPEAMADALTAGACDYVMPDVGRIGGVTGWMQAAGMAAAHGIEMSSHLVPEVSVHLLAATPSAHWLEYVDWADAILAEPLRVIEGGLTPSARPGVGLAWDEAKLKRLDAV